MGEESDARYGQPPRGSYDELGPSFTLHCLIYPRSISTSILKRFTTTEQVSHLVDMGQRMFTPAVAQRNRQLTKPE